MLTTSIIIPTYNRPKDLENCLRSLLQQTQRVDELIIIDDGDLESVPLWEACREKGIRCLYRKKDKPGLTASRNLGITLATMDILFFLDDDVVLYPDYIEQICLTFDHHDDKLDGPLGGVGGVIVNHKPLRFHHRLRRLSDRLFLVTGPVEGRVLPSGFCVNFGATGRLPTDTHGVDFLAGGVSAYPKRIFKTFRFSEAYTGYGLGEDKDFSFRVSRQYRLLINPDAKLYHHESPKMRFDKHRLGREYVISRHRFFRDCLLVDGGRWFWFYYALFGYTLGRLLIAVLSMKKSEFQRMAGIFSGIGAILTGRGAAERG